MTNWKTHLDALVAESQAFSRAIPTLSPRTVDRPRLPPALRQTGGQREATTDLALRGQLVGFSKTKAPLAAGPTLREEIAQRVAQFRAHQQRLIRERKNYADGQVTRMQDLLAATGIKRLQSLPT